MPEFLSRCTSSSSALDHLDGFFAGEPIILFEAAATASRSGFCLKTDCDVFRRLIGCVASTLFAGPVEVVRWDIVEADDGRGRLGNETGGGGVIPKDGGNGLAARRFLISGLATGLTEDTWSSRISQRLSLRVCGRSLRRKRRAAARLALCYREWDKGIKIIRKIQMLQNDVARFPNTFARGEENYDDRKNRTLWSFV